MNDDPQLGARTVSLEEMTGKPDECWLLAAAKAKLPIVVPGYEDSTFGNIFASHVKLGEPFALYHAIGLALVLGGIWLSERKR